MKLFQDKRSFTKVILKKRIMTSIEFHLRSSVRAKRSKGSLFIRVIRNRIPRSITTPFRIYPEEWDSTGNCLVYHSDNRERFSKLRKISEELEQIRMYLEEVVGRFEMSGSDFSSSDIIAAYRQRQGEHLLSDFVDRLCLDLFQTGRDRTARGYQTVVNRIVRFTGEKNLLLKQITPLLVRRFEYSLQQEGKAVNTISFYMRNLRAIYNKAVRQGLLPASLYCPFENVFTGVKITKKRALTKEEMSTIDNILNRITSFEKLSSKSGEEMRKSCLLFLFSFYARGMSFVDVAYLRKENLKNNVITYKRRKTGQLLEIKLTSSMKHILQYFNKYTQNSSYLFPIIHREGVPERLQYESALRIQNNRLKKIAVLCGLEKNLSTHVARHTWATIAKQEHLPLAVISEGLGHTSEKTTAIYLASFNRSVLDKANEKVGRAIRAIG